MECSSSSNEVQQRQQCTALATECSDRSSALHQWSVATAKQVDGMWYGKQGHTPIWVGVWCTVDEWLEENLMPLREESIPTY